MNERNSPQALTELLTQALAYLTELQAILTDADTEETLVGALEMFLRGETPDPDTRYELAIVE